MGIKKENQKNQWNIKRGDKVWWYHPLVICTVFNVNKKDAHIRNSSGYMEWISLEKLHKIEEDK
jgi:hypothetical protein